MIFKRNEGFRFTFEEPVKAAFRLMKNGKLIEPPASYMPAEILDISPKGMKIASTFKIAEELTEDVQFFIVYCIDTIEIQSYGELVWKRSLGADCVYGLYFNAQEENEQTIISELKSRRRKELKMGERRA